MTDRYRRPRSPVHNPARASLPINLPGYDYDYAGSHDHDHHVRAVPTSRREQVPPTHPRSGSSTSSNAGTVTTTYKITADPPPSSRSSSTRNGSRSRSSTVDSHNRPTIVTTVAQRPKPVVHGGSPASPLKNPYRQSDEDYYTIPASSQNLHSRNKRHSAMAGDEDTRRPEKERERDRLRVSSATERAPYPSSRSRPIYPHSAARPVATFGDDYSDDGYGYTRPRDLVEYDLDHTAAHNPRRESLEVGRRSRPTSVGNYDELAAGSYDSRSRGPPPSTRGFDKFTRGSTWDQPTVRMPAAPLSPFEPIQRPARVEPPFEEQPPRRSYSHRPSYHDHERERGSRDDYYEVRDDDPRSKREKSRHISPQYHSPVEQRGFGIRAEAPPKSERSEKSDRLERIERQERPERVERSDRHERSSRVEKPERTERLERSERSERPERSNRSETLERSQRSERSDEERPEHKKGKEALAAGLGIAGAALGINAAKKTKGDHDERDERSRERRLEIEHVELDGRDPKERLVPQRERDAERGAESDKRQRHKHHREKARSSGTDSESDNAALDHEDRKSHRESRPKRGSGSAQPAFNPKDTMDLRALKEALNSKDSSASKEFKERAPSKSPRPSVTKDFAEASKVRVDLDKERRSRADPDPADKPHARVVSPPRAKNDDKPVKGILRAPREKFPEDLAPIREGVAPLKDAKKDGVPPDARWTKISRRLVNPEALELGKERYEARDDFVIVLRVLSRDEVQGYAEITQKLRAAREEAEELEAREGRRRARRERHERHKRERSRGERSERRRRRRDRDSESSDTSEDDDGVRDRDVPKMLEPAPPRRRLPSNNFEEPIMSGGLGSSTLRENPHVPGQYLGYTRNPPPPSSMITQSSGSSRRDLK